MRPHIFAFASLLTSLAASMASAEATVNFDRDVLPLLSDRCFHCHGPDQSTREAELRFDLREVAVSSGAIVPGNPERSELIARVMSDEPAYQMPPADSHRKSLSIPEISLLRRWIEEGAVWGKHWAFEKIQRPNVPNAEPHPIDAFILRRLSEVGLQFSPQADRRTIIRRVTLDLTGLPPTPAEINAFVADASPDAYEKVVDRLLASPHYGERMAWDWLDVARYADTAGYQDDPERSMWPWRDWLIDAFNRNMPFDQFTIEQLAGDLLPNATGEQRLATAFNRNHMYNSEGGRIPEETRVENVFDRVETTGTAWLGLTLQCARCHDHKFDPTTTKDYFAFSDFFNQTSETGEVDRSIAVPPYMQYEATGKDPVKVMIMDTRGARRDTCILAGGIYDNVTEVKVSANVPAMLPPLPPKEGHEPYNRLDLARWIVSRENPLTARVIANRMWQLFFGRGIVTSPDDFGLQGQRPSHPDLLDWLATEFVESGWDVKHIQRLIVTSKTYLQESKVRPELASIDPDNSLLSRGSRLRMPSWMLRDQALAASGLLAPTIGGPPVKPYQPEGIWEEATFGQIRYQRDSGEKLYRRSIYVFWRRIAGPTMFFDAAKRQACQVTPSLTNTPLHALTTLNDVAFVEAARVLAERLLMMNASDEERLDHAFQLLTARRSQRSELELLIPRLHAYRSYFENHPKEAEGLLDVGESPHAKSVNANDLAAYTAVVNTLMNLDEALVNP